MSRKHSTATTRKRTQPPARWIRYILAGALLLAVLGATGIAAQLLWASASPDVTAALSTAPMGANAAGANSESGAGSNARTLYVHGDRLRPLVEETDGAPVLNIYGPGGRIIAQVAPDGSGSEEARHLLADHLGSTRLVLDGEGTTVARFEYGPYGETASGTAATVRYRYTGHPYDEAQGVYETPARGYDPTLGRFLSVDPQRQDASPYVYAGNNPVGFLDPTGGGKVPFFMRSGFWGLGEEQSFTSKGWTKGEVRSRLEFVKDISDTLGMHGGQQIQDATRTFGSNPLKKPTIIDHAPVFLRGPKGSNRKFQYDDLLYWFVGDEKDIVLPTHFHEAVQSIRAVSRENFAGFEYASPNFAENIVLVDFTQPGSDAIRRVSEFLSGGEYKVWGVAASEILQRPDNLRIPEPLVGQQGPDARGGAGPAPPPTSIDASTGQSIRQLQGNIPTLDPNEIESILRQPFPGQSQYSQPMQEETRFRSTSMQPTVITTLDPHGGD